MPGLRYGGAFKAVVHGESKDERIARCQTTFELAQRAVHPLIRRYLVLSGICKCTRGWLVGKLGDVVGPVRLRWSAQLSDDFHAIANLGSAVGVYCMFEDSFVVINEQPRRGKPIQVLLHLLELNSPGNGVSGATAQLSLVINGRTL